MVTVWRCPLKSKLASSSGLSLLKENPFCLLEGNIFSISEIEL